MLFWFNIYKKTNRKSHHLHFPNLTTLVTQSSPLGGSNAPKVGFPRHKNYWSTSWLTHTYLFLKTRLCVFGCWTFFLLNIFGYSTVGSTWFLFLFYHLRRLFCWYSNPQFSVSFNHLSTVSPYKQWYIPDTNSSSPCDTSESTPNNNRGKNDWASGNTGADWPRRWAPSEPARPQGCPEASLTTLWD